MNDTFDKLIRQYSPNITESEKKEVIDILEKTAPRIQLCQNPDLIPVQNGIINRKTKKLMPFSPEYVFIHKFRARYVMGKNGPFIIDEYGLVHDIDKWLQAEKGYKPWDLSTYR